MEASKVLVIGNENFLALLKIRPIINMYFQKHIMMPLAS